MPATLHHTPAPPAPPRVRTRGRLRTLEFQPGMVQSEMHVADPDRLVLAYARAMMCFVLFQPRPAHIVMVGLGGGSLAKFCYRYLPHSRITVIELRADVIALRAQFAIPPDDERFSVVHADASHYMATLRGAADVLLVDGFDQDGLPPALASAAFYADCRRALRPGGVLVANVFSYDPQYPAVLRRLRACFRQRVGSFHGIAGNNRLLFAINSTSAVPTPAQRALQRAAHRRGPAWGLAHRLLAHWTVLRLRWLNSG
ncbi:transferase spermidine synthase [Massilia sp. Root418]|jgi:spermidine synthase|uniref:spermine/spermidine synthase domain-containing protein n=1 Tax=Massilia sp. Root418 TaxID=1736532 RepID=UPI0006F8FE07|nr:transferase spermidine synthase [Massilia sp. Root418]KQW87207.1 transferase spermidine synthase [Massilia sp. Root418]